MKKAFLAKPLRTDQNLCRPPAERELERANEIHGLAVDALQIEARAMQSQFFVMVQHPLNSAPKIASMLRDGESIMKHAGSYGSVLASRTSMVNSFIVRAVVGLSIMTTKQACPTNSVITSRTNASSLVNMFRSTIAARCTPIA